MKKKYAIFTTLVSYDDMLFQGKFYQAVLEEFDTFELAEQYLLGQLPLDKPNRPRHEKMYTILAVYI